MNTKAKYFGLGILFTIIMIILLIGITFILPLANGLLGPDTIAIIPVDGDISYYSDVNGSSTTSPDIFKDNINQANSDPSVGGILLVINSGGGSVVASEEMMESVKNSKKPVVAWISEQGASGAYLVASGSDKIVAHESSLVGSIGTIITLYDLSGYYEQLGIIPYSIVAGEYKDMGADYRNLTLKEKNLIQKLVNDDYQQFLNHVAENRNLSKTYVKKIADGKIYNGKEALKLKLVDYTGSKEYALSLIANISGLDQYYQVLIYSNGVQDLNNDISPYTQLNNILNNIKT
ncbi:signal peptide peptidase SppA [Methanobrevibacter curvatus]|uniref:Putative signal peptide peptidase SppA n=1 Tax=Methanobrevibacter curvatus TaxID=49547 RepID=A0A166A979_9EURY|nr:signal peptide peptidase SppA [Methanobrevibacter curvatus]KZX11733.1 putative signal peptide peptidase SppA [Methanobrevibacter curvatus]